MKSSLRIVILDDDSFIVEHTATCVRHWARDAEIITFTKAASALRELERTAPDLFVTDIYHDEPSGYQILKNLSTQRVAYPILVISGNAKEKRVRGYAKSGLKVDFLPKPWTEERLHSVLTGLFTGPLGEGRRPKEAVPAPASGIKSSPQHPRLSSPPARQSPPDGPILHRLEKYDPEPVRRIRRAHR